MTQRTLGIHHVVLTVSDIDRSAEFYARVLGLRRGGDESASWRYLTDGTVHFIVQRAPDAPIPEDRFDENRVGLDHVAFAVPSRTELEATLAVLRAMAIPSAGIEHDPDGDGDYIAFRDPDNIQVEVYIADS